MMSCAVIDDEPLAREGIAGYAQELDFLNLVGTCENPVQLINLLAKQKVDLIFLDIQMPKMTGLDFLKTTPNPPITIITTAFPGFALEGFQLNVLDYLVKPITFDRFVKSAAKANDYFRLLTQTQPKTNMPSAEKYFFIKCGNKFEKISVGDILYVESMQNYVVVHTASGKHTTLLTLKAMAENLPEALFIKVHKSFIVSIPMIDSMEGNEIHVKGHRVPVSRTFREEVLKKVVTAKLLGRG